MVSMLNTRSSVGRMRGQVNKLVEIEALEIYCDMYEGNMDFLSVDKKGDFDNWCQSRLQSDSFGYLLKPVHVCVTLLVMERCYCVLTSVVTIEPLLHT